MGGNTIKLTEEAYGLVAEMAHDCDATMRDVASEAIMRFRRQRDNRQYAFGAFALGAIAGGALMFFVGMV